METARVFNENAGIDQIMSAVDFERQYKGNKQLGIIAETPLNLDDFEIVSPKDGQKLWHRNSSAPMGATKERDACFYYPQERKDYKPENDIKAAIEENYPILVNLNMPILSADNVDFSSLQEFGAEPLERWISSKRGQHICLSVTSAKQTRDTIKSIGKISPSYLQDNVFVSYRNGVIPFKNFYLGGSNSHKTQNLFNNLSSQNAGIINDSNTILGFPRLHGFMPAGTTISDQGKKGLKSAPIKQLEGKPLIGSIVISSEEANNANPNLILNAEIASNNTKTYVLACPQIRTDKAKNEWKVIEWQVNDPSVQIDTGMMQP